MINNAPINVIYVTSDTNHLNFTEINIRLIDSSINLKSAFHPYNALELIKTGKFECILIDYMMEEIRGDEFCKKILEVTDIPCILYTDWKDAELAELAFKSGIEDIVKKERDIDHYNVLVKSIRQAVEKYWQNKLYHNIVEDCPDGVLILTGSTIAYVNDTFLELFDIGRKSDVIGLNTYGFLEEREKRLLNGIDARQGRDDEPVVHSFLYTMEDGITRRLEASVSFITYKSQPAKLIFLRDITEKAQREHLLESLHQHASHLSFLEDMNEMVRVTLDIMEDLLGFEFASFLIVDHGVLRTLGTRGAPIVDIFLPLEGRGITVRAVREGRAQYVRDVRVDPDFVRGSTDSLSELAVPVLVEGKAVAVLNVESLKIDAFSTHDQQLIEILAMHVGSVFSRLNK